VGDTWDYADPNLNEIVNGGFPTITTKSAYATVVQAEPPAAPSDLAATLNASVPQIYLSWTDNANNEMGFVVERADNGGAFTQIATLPSNNISFVDTNVTFGNLYEYEVAATNASGTSGFAGPVSVDMTASPPAAPTSLVADVLSATQVGLTWTDNASNETGYVVQRCTGAGCSNFAPLTTLAADSVSYTDATVAVPNSYSYRVLATNGVGSSGPSNVVSVSITVPPAPTNLTATNISRTGFTLNWVYNFPQPDGFEIQVSTNSSFTAIVQSFPDVNADQTSLVISGLIRNTTYYVRIRAFNAVGPGPWSATRSVRTSK
jgi:fibronectin type 3 domain-containing protein